MLTVNKNPRPPGQNANATYPELPFDKDWSDLVRATRKAKGWSQDELAERADCTQAMISNIENYTTQQSHNVVPIARVLGIPLPRAYSEDDKEMQWRVLGEDLRRDDPDAFANLLQLAESIVRGKNRS